MAIASSHVATAHTSESNICELVVNNASLEEEIRILRAKNMTLWNKNEALIEEAEEVRKEKAVL